MNQEDHKDLILDKFTNLMTAKYDKGAREHGGNLWDKSGLIDMAIDEAIDQLTYLITLKDQIEQSGVQLGSELE